MAALAAALSLTPEQLTRPLDETEQTALRFERLSARHSRILWGNVRALCEQRGLDYSTAAKIMDLDPNHVSEAFADGETRHLTFEPAARLAAHLGLETPGALFPDMRQRDTGHEHDK